MTNATIARVEDLKAAGEDFEWYPTTPRMVAAILRDLQEDSASSLLDIGAGDGRVLLQMAETHPHATLYAIEKSAILRHAQPDQIIPVGTLFEEQDLMALPVGIAFCNPPYSEYETWAARIIATVHAEALYLILPQRWEGSALIAAALKAREVHAEIILRDDFHDGARNARAVVHVLRVRFTEEYSRWQNHHAPDPFDAWFDAHIDTFDKEGAIPEDRAGEALARIRGLRSIPELVAAYQEDYARMEHNYRTIFTLDAALLKELGVGKQSVREGLKARMKGLKTTYWEALFAKLDVITCRLTTKTKEGFLKRITGQTAIAFTEDNAYAVVLWAIKAANQYFDVQVIEVFKALATHDGVANYTSNQRTWIQEKWRYNAHGEKEEQNSHYKLDYRIVLQHHAAIFKADFGRYEYPGNLHKNAHEQIADLVAVFGNLGFRVQGIPSWDRQWVANQWQDFTDNQGAIVFQVKAFQNGNLHFRMRPDAIKALNIEAGRLLGWLKSPGEAVSELGVTEEEAARYFGANRKLGAGVVKQLIGTVQEGV